MKSLAIFTYTLLILFFLYIDKLSAQKLPNIQDQSKWLPSNVKIDGKFTEWNDVLMAFQKSNHLEYTIAHDSTRLYLAFRSADKATTAKILAGGISLLINNSGKKAKDQGPEITFPVTHSSYEAGSVPGAVRANFSILTDSVAIVYAITQFKEIKLTSVPEFPDGILSIYNQDGVKTKLSYNGNALTGEYIVPLKLLGITALGSSFVYNIKLNGVKMPASNIGGVPPPPLSLPPGRSPNSMFGIAIEVQTPTNFEGKYLLTNKDK